MSAMKDPLYVPVSPAELLDKKTILEVKRERIVAADKLANVERELALLTGIANEVYAQAGDRTALAALEAELFAINGTLWDRENIVRACEKEGRFDEEFIRTARSIYAGNDQRAAIKRRINLALGALLVEEKEHLAPPSHGRTAG